MGWNEEKSVYECTITDSDFGRSPFMKWFTEAVRSGEISFIDERLKGYEPQILLGAPNIKSKKCQDGQIEKKAL